MSHWPPSGVEEWMPWNFVICELNWHRKNSRHTWIETLNRLLKKGEFVGNSLGQKLQRADVPKLTPATLSATRESWTLDQLITVRHPASHSKQQPQCDACPIIVLCIFGICFAVDGGTRINRRIRDEDQGPHDVVVIRHESEDI